MAWVPLRSLHSRSRSPDSRWTAGLWANSKDIPFFVFFVLRPFLFFGHVFVFWGCFNFQVRVLYYPRFAGSGLYTLLKSQVSDTKFEFKLENARHACLKINGMTMKGIKLVSIYSRFKNFV